MLKVSIFSFSYIYGGIPEDKTGNEGGFVFDCRFIENPGKYDKFEHLTGRDEDVIKFLDAQQPAQDFLKNVYGIISSAVDKYTERGFTNLMVCFGCTGGQHRSVYSAEKLSAYLTEKYPDTAVELTHCNL